MAAHDTIDGAECTTTGSFDDHGIANGSDLVARTYYRLAAGDATFEPTEAFYDRLTGAFRWAYLGATDSTTVPDGVAAAIEDARHETREVFADEPDADLRTEVLPAFYRSVAAYHCAYR